MRTGERRSAAQREHDRALVARLALEGATQAAIARRLAEQTGRAISQQQVSKDLRAVREEWKRDRLRAHDDLVVEELAKLGHLERTYWEGFRRSQGEPAPEPPAGDGDGPGGDDGGAPSPASSRRRRSGQAAQGAGDPRWLAGVLECIKRRILLLRLDAPPPVDLAALIEGPYERPIVEASVVEEAWEIFQDFMANPGGNGVVPGTYRPLPEIPPVTTTVRVDRVRGR